MDDSVIISHVENECAPPPHNKPVPDVRNATADNEAAFNKLLDKAYTPYGYKSLDVLRMSD